MTCQSPDLKQEFFFLTRWVSIVKQELLILQKFIPRIVVLFIPHLACRQPHFMHLSLYFDGPTILVLYFICIGEDQAFANVYQVTILLALMVP